MKNSLSLSRIDPMTLRYNLNIFLPVLILLGCIAVPSPASSVFFFFLLIFHLHICISLTFDGFTRFSRYRLSNYHPVLDKFLSVLTIVLCFMGLSAIALLMIAYSHYVSPDNDGNDRKYIIKNIIYAGVLIVGFIALFVRY